MSITAILIDNREPSWVQELKFGGAIKAVSQLDFGDAWITTDNSDMICIERKTPTDLLSSIGDDRLFCQIQGIRQRTPWSYLIVTGPLVPTVTGLTVAGKQSTGWRWDSVWGALLTVQEIGARVLFCATDGDYEGTVTRLCNRRRGAQFIIEPTIDARPMTDGERFLTSLPGIGIEKAAALLREFDGSAAQALSWLTWHRWNVDIHVAGIGVGIKKAVRTAIGMDDSMVFDIVRDEALQEKAA